ncbi:MAG: class I SAM-dependent DNA methyltransferase [Gammaproteobacteria bacterium]|nr:class I SAM-dependent DNA methyltransferase [Gammaproteobacteria bacterium]
MDLNTLEKDINSLVKNLNKDEFIYDFLLAYHFPKSTITRLKKGDYNKSKNSNASNQEILWKKSLFFKVEQQQDLHLSIDDAQKDPSILKQHPRFIIVTDFKRLLAVDTKTADSLDIPLAELSQNYTFFLPWAGMEKTQIQSLNLADVKAAEKLAQLYDIIVQENHIETDADRHGLNIFLSRLLFCFFAEDTGIFEDNQFTNAIASHTNDDGSDLQNYLIALFKVMNIKKRTTEPKHIKDFPYVNGGLFAVDYPAPKLNAKARKMIIDAGTLNWKQINPDIFGSMMQAVVHSDQRGSLGMHYTSVANIMKVIEPLFLNDLKMHLNDIISSEKGIENKLKKLLDRLYHLRLFDPACGSGNFLIIAYKELCKLEIEIFKQLQSINHQFSQVDNWKNAKSGLRLSQFYGIELDDFAHETAKLSLWLAEHQMNLAFKEVFGSAKPTLPLQEGGHIVCGNATRLDWEKVCPKDNGAEIYIMGNPPFYGKKEQSKDQKNEIKNLFKDISGYGVLDYVCCWYLKAAIMIKDSRHKCAFVSTNSIVQGEQTSILWHHLNSNYGINLFFAHRSFKWKNNAKGNAAVHCVIVGFTSYNYTNKFIYVYKNYDQLQSVKSVKVINNYLLEMDNVFIKKRTRVLSSGFSSLIEGITPLDNGILSFTNDEYLEFISAEPQSKKWFKEWVTGQSFLQGKLMYCLWLVNITESELNKLPLVLKKVEQVRKFRENSKSSQKFAETPWLFRERTIDENYIFIPKTSSERREYIPAGFIKDAITSSSSLMLNNASTWYFSIITSRIHMTWVRAVAGRLKTDYRYSASICYNTFPFPKISEAQKTTLEDHVFNVLDEREKHQEKTMAELYDPDKMPDGLKQAHHDMDLAVEQCYRKQPFKNDEERLEYLFKLYEKMIKAEKNGK